MDRKSSSSIFLTSFLFLSSLFFIVFSENASFKSFHEAGFSLFSGYQHRSHLFFDSIVDAFTAIYRLRALEKKYDLLIRKQNYYVLQQKLYEEEKKNEILRGILQYSQELPYRHITGRVFARESWGSLSSFSIDVGKKDAIQEGNAVLAVHDERLVLVGRVASLSDNAAIVRSLNDTSMYVAARLTHQRYDGLISGKGNYLAMNYVDSNVRNSIYYDDEVVTAGINDIIPADIPIGLVRKIHSRNHEEYIELQVEPYIQSNYFEYVFVVIPEE